MIKRIIDSATLPNAGLIVFAVALIADVLVLLTDSALIECGIPSITYLARKHKAIGIAFAAWQLLLFAGLIVHIFWE